MAKSEGLTFAQICKSIKEQKFVPIYLFMGEEPYYIDYLSDLVIKNSITEEDKDFNFTDFYGLDSDVRQIITTCRRFPMMSDRQVVVIHEAQMLNDIDLLRHYVEKPLDSTILIICNKGGKIKATETLKILKSSDKAVIFESKCLTDKNIEAEILAYASERGITLQPKAVSMLHEFIGTDISSLHRSIDKLAIITPKGQQITPDDIEHNIGISKDYNSFELLNSIKNRNAEIAIKILQYYRSDPKNHSVQPLTAMLFNFFAKALLFKTSRDRSEAGLMKATDSKSAWQLKYLQQEVAAFSPRDCFFAIGWLRKLDTMSKGVNSYKDAYDLFQDAMLKIILNRS